MKFPFAAACLKFFHRTTLLRNVMCKFHSTKKSSMFASLTQFFNGFFLRGTSWNLPKCPSSLDREDMILRGSFALAPKFGAVTRSIRSQGEEKEKQSKRRSALSCLVSAWEDCCFDAFSVHLRSAGRWKSLTNSTSYLACFGHFSLHIPHSALASAGTSILKASLIRQNI